MWVRLLSGQNTEKIQNENDQGFKLSCDTEDGKQEMKKEKPELSYRQKSRYFITGSTMWGRLSGRLQSCKHEIMNEWADLERHSVVKRTGCSFRGPELNFRQPHGGSQLSITPLPGNSMNSLFWSLWGQSMYLV